MAKIITWLVVLGVIVVGALAIFNGGGNKESVIKLGAILPLTGDAASYGESESRAIQIAIDEINKDGGVNGNNLELVLEDGKCDPQAGGSAAQKLVNIDAVKIILGGACSGETLAAAKITEPAKVILISPSASSPKVTEAGDFVFRTYPSDALAGKIAAKYAYKELNGKKAALITELTDYAQGLREVYKSAFTSLGGKVVADETYKTGDTDFRTQILKIKSANPDVVYVVPQSFTPGVAIMKQLKENKVLAKLTTAEVLLDRQGVKDNAQVLEGIIGVEPAVDWDKNPKASALSSAHRAKYKSDPGTFSANAYDAVYLIAGALEATAKDAIDTLKVRDWLYAVKDWPGAVGPLTIDMNGDPVMGESLRKISGGEVTDLGPYTP